MLWRKLCFKLVQLVFTLWAMASIVFLLSRFLPGLSSPKGMNDPDVNILSHTSPEAVLRIKEAYLQKHGLHLPKFYLSFSLKGEKNAGQISSASVDEAWVRKSVLWHGLETTSSFYRQWQQAYSNADLADQSTALKSLIKWSNSNSPTERQLNVAQFEAVLKKIDRKQRLQLTKEWQHLTLSSSPWYFFLPSLEWHGTNSQYHLWLQNILSGNLGVSNSDYEPVLDKLSEALKNSAILGAIALLIASAIAYSLGLWLAESQNKPFCIAVRQTLYLLDSIPVFLLVLGLLFLYLLFGGTLSGNDIPSEGTFSILFQSSFLLSTISVVLLLLPYLCLQFYQGLNHEADSMYMRTARAKGLSINNSLRKHALPNSFGPSLTILSEAVIGLIAGVLVVEVTFSLPGVGSLLTRSILSSDYPVLIASTLFLLLFRIVVVWITDLLLAFVDPRIRLS